MSDEPSEEILIPENNGLICFKVERLRLMKRCPSCQRTYPDDAPDFCPNDGMRLVKEEAAAFDPEKTMMRSDVIAETPTQQPPAPTTPPVGQQQPLNMPTPDVQPPPPQQGQQSEQTPPMPQQWQPQEGNQFQQQAAWSPTPPAQQQAAPVWSSPSQQQPVGAPFGAQFAPTPSSGRSRAIAIAALVFGVDAATIMSFAVIRDVDFLTILLYALPILAIVLGVTSLLLALKRPSRFGGVELAIIGLALGAAGLVFILMRRF